MKRILVFAFVTILFIGAYTKTEASTPQFDHKLIQLTEETSKMGFHIKKWSFFSREEKEFSGMSEFETEKDRLKAKFPGFHWLEKADSKTGRVSLEGVQKDKGHITETISLYVYPQKEQLNAYFIYVVDGNEWNKTLWKEFSPTAEKTMAKIFRDQPQIFSCVTGESGDTMDIVLSKKADAIRSDFHAKKIEQVKEKTFISQSAYTKAWKDSIQTNEHKMNLQIALRKTGKKTTLTLGTPIITSEY